MRRDGEEVFSGAGQAVGGEPEEPVGFVVERHGATPWANVGRILAQGALLASATDAVEEGFGSVGGEAAGSTMANGTVGEATAADEDEELVGIDSEVVLN